MIVNNSVTANGPVGYIAQNGIQVAFGATGAVIGNTVSGNDYTPTPVIACGLLYFQAAGVRASMNTLRLNERNSCNVGKGGGNFNPTP